jgi:hypothetical protein
MATTIAVVRKSNVVNTSVNLNYQCYLCSASVINSSLLLPSAVELDGRWINFIREDNNLATTFTIYANGAELIGNTNSVALRTFHSVF